MITYHPCVEVWEKAGWNRSKIPGLKPGGWFCKLPRNDAEDLWAHRQVHVSWWSQGQSAAGPFCVDLALGWTSNSLIIIEWFIKCFSRCCSTFVIWDWELEFIHIYIPFLSFSVVLIPWTSPVSLFKVYVYAILRPWKLQSWTCFTGQPVGSFHLWFPSWDDHTPW